MGNQCCSQTPNESNQVETAVNRETVQKPSDQETSARKQIATFKNHDQDSDENKENHTASEKKVNVYEKNQDEHYPNKTTAVEVESLPQSDNMGMFRSILKKPFNEIF